MRRKILKRKYVARGQSHDRLRVAGSRKFAEALQYRNELLDRAIVVHNDDQRPVGATAKQHQEQGFCRRRKSGDTYPPRALPQVGGYTHERGKHFYVRKEFANEGKKHAL